MLTWSTNVTKRMNVYKGSCNHRIQVPACDGLAADLLIYQFT